MIVFIPLILSLQYESFFMQIWGLRQFSKVDSLLQKCFLIRFLVMILASALGLWAVI